MTFQFIYDKNTQEKNIDDPNIPNTRSRRTLQIQLPYYSYSKELILTKTLDFAALILWELSKTVFRIILALLGKK